MPNVPQLVPETQFPTDAVRESVQVAPAPTVMPTTGWLTMNIASAADEIVQWGRSPALRDRQLRDFWPNEPYLAGAMSNIAFRNASFLWEIQGPDKISQAVTDMMLNAISNDTIGWVPFIETFSQDLYGQDNGAFQEIIRDPGMDANSPFKNERAPVIGLANLDANLCTRTGNPEFPIIYTDENGKFHKLPWYSVIPFADFASAIRSMHGVGYCAVTRALKLSQYIRSIILYKTEKVAGRHYKQMHFVSGVSKQELKDEMARGQEDANNAGMIRYIMPAILASLDPEKPVSTATIDLASLPDGFDFDQEMKWYIAGLALDFGMDYQDLAPLPGGNIGSSQQSVMLDRKSNGKGPASYMLKIAQAYKSYGVMPRSCKMAFQDKDEQEALERQMVRTKAAEEYAIVARSGILSPDAIRQDSVKRGIYDQALIDLMDKEYGVDILNRSKSAIGQTGGNTLAEDASRTETGNISETSGAQLRKEKGLIQTLLSKLPISRGVHG